MPSRDYYIDRIRVLMTALVVFHHAAITYGGPGGWFYQEVRPNLASLSGRILMLLLAVNQAYFMGFFFLLAGYYAPASLDRKGARRFLQDRFLRLGLPLLAFGFLLAPLTIWLIERQHGTSFAVLWAVLWKRRQFENGPLWFAQALLLFSLVYVAWRKGRPPQTPAPSAPPPDRFWLAAALLVGAAAVAIRLYVPVGRNVFGLQLGYFASYIALFAIGCAAWYGRWLDTLTMHQAIRWMIVAAVAIPLLPVTLILFPGNPGEFAGGWHPQAVLYAFWEPFVAWGVMAGFLVVTREYFNRPSRAWEYLARRAYGVFIVHPPVLVACSLALRGWSAPPLTKFAFVGLLACLGSWLVADLLVRLSGVNRVV